MLAEHRDLPLGELTGQGPGRLAGGSDGDALERFGDHDRETEDGRRYGPDRGGLGRATGQSDPADVAGLLAQHLDPVGQAPQHALDGGPGDIGRRHVLQRQSEQLAGRVRQRRRPLPLQVRHEGDTLAPGRSTQSEPVELGQVDAEQFGGRDEVAGAVEGAHQRQEGTGRVGEAGDRAGRLVGLPLGRMYAVPLVPSEMTASPGFRPRPSAAAMLSPVPGAMAIPCGVSADDLVGGGDAGQVELVAEGELDQVLRYSLLVASK